MDKQTEYVYNIFSWWLVVWYFLYINKLISINPFIAAAMSILFDLFGAYYVSTDKNNNTNDLSPNKQIVVYFRILAIIFSHWIPFLSLPRSIEVISIITLCLLTILYIFVLHIQGLTITSIYDLNNNNNVNYNSLYQLFKLRFGNIPMGILGFVFLFYTGFILLKNPAKGSLLYKVIS